MFLTLGKLIMGRKFKKHNIFRKQTCFCFRARGTDCLFVSFIYCFVTQHNIFHLEALWRLWGKVRHDFRRLLGLVGGMSAGSFFRTAADFRAQGKV